MNEKNQPEEQRSSSSGLYVILMVNAMIWAIAVIASVAVSIAWRKKDFS